MTAPANTTTKAPQQSTAVRGRREGEPSSTPDAIATSGMGSEEADELADLARKREEAEDRAQELVAAQVLRQARNGGPDDRERSARLLESARQELMLELRGQEQEQARQQLAAATRGSEDAVAGLVRGVTTIVRSVIPAVLIRPEDVIETTYALADQGLRMTRQLALTVTGSVRGLAA